MKFFILVCIFLTSNITAEELKVKSKSFFADEKKGISVFTGKVNVIKANDELNASKVTIYTDKKNQPIKFIAEGDATFVIFTEAGSKYKGKAQKVIYYTNKKEYYFYRSVHLIQIDEKKEIIGEEVVLKTIEGRAHAKSSKTEPVIMIFNIPEKKKK